MRLFLVGDAHGNSGFMNGAIRAAADLGDIDAVMQLGDFGFWPGYVGEDYFHSVSATAKKTGMPLWVIDGNHDWPELYRSVSTRTPNFTPTLQHVPRGTTITLAGRTVGFLGGAISIDQVWRRKMGHGWWPDEELTEFETAAATQHGPLDVMLSHDAPLPPILEKWSFGPEVDEKIEQHAARFERVLAAWRPKVHVHGHWHARYQCHTPWGIRLGLAHEGASSGIAILDTETLELT